MRPFRKEKVGSAVHEIIGELLLRGMNDPRIDRLTTVTRVEMSGDLMLATVYVSVPGPEAAERRTLQALQHAAGHVRRVVSQGLSMRTTPDVRFAIDHATKLANETLRLIGDNRRAHPELYPAETEPAEGEPGEVVDSDGDEPEADDEVEGTGNEESRA